MTFTAVVVSLANESGLRNMLGQLRYQTVPPDETIVLCADTPDVARLCEDFPDVLFHERETRNDWGHSDRDYGLSLTTSEWVGFFNDDDRYANDYIEKMLKAAGNHTAVYCAWPYSPDCSFALGQSTSGNFIVKTELAQRVGWRHRHYEADGMFIEEVVRAGASIVKVPEILYWHNEQ